MKFDKEEGNFGRNYSLGTLTQTAMRTKRANCEDLSVQEYTTNNPKQDWKFSHVTRLSKKGFIGYDVSENPYSLF